MRPVRVVAAAVLVLAATGCSTAAPPVTDPVGSAVRSAVAGQGLVIDDLACGPDPAPAVGQTGHCSYRVDGQPVDVDTEVTSMDGGVPVYRITTAATPIPKALLERRVGEDMDVEDAGAVVCAGDLPPRPGSTVACTVRTGRTTEQLVATATDTVDGMPGYRLEPAGT